MGSLNGGGRECRCIVTYRRTDGQVVIAKEGHGSSYTLALKDADEQLRPGEWTRLVISTPDSIYADLKNTGRMAGGAGKRNPRGEGETVLVPEPVVRGRGG